MIYWGLKFSTRHGISSNTRNMQHLFWSFEDDYGHYGNKLYVRKVAEMKQLKKRQRKLRQSSRLRREKTYQSQKTFSPKNGNKLNPSYIRIGFKGFKKKMIILLCPFKLEDLWWCKAITGIIQQKLTFARASIYSLWSDIFVCGLKWISWKCIFERLKENKND